jgi:hypothetical protein
MRCETLAVLPLRTLTANAPQTRVWLGVRVNSLRSAQNMDRTRPPASYVLRHAQFDIPRLHGRFWYHKASVLYQDT